ncbi:hypothetical protein [Desulfovibrio sp. Huiquan2017]|uniref:hypothetical protein n=1 Tax=Desulfovibrio sp. Huiquan2017 TaxID=2816861 RepID=UPI001A931756|nr:hypothetical protein [Desulfovibrio sp. Huiquan2017]
MDTSQAFREKNREKIRVISGLKNDFAKGNGTGSLLYEFDEGDSISFDEGTHGVLVIGGVGRGKTTSFMLPMAYALMKEGRSGLIVDVKNNFTAQIRKLAKATGREDDIIEIGTHPTATPINLLDGLSLEETQNALESLILTGLEHSSNVDWLHKGVRLLADLVMLLRFIRPYDERFVPSFALLDRCINDYDFSKKVFDFFLSHVYTRDNYAHRSFVTRIRSTAFHILTETKIKSYHEQLDYQLRGPRQILAAITSDDSLVSSLSCHTAALRLNYRELLKAGKIILLRFKNTHGHAARLLARHIKERYYSDVYRTLDDCRQQEKCFFMADEYQDVINVSPNNPFDDFSWFSKAREFGCVNIVATQTLSGLYANNLLRDQVNALVANCSTKIILQNDDPAADSYFRHFCGLEKTLAQLDSCEALVTRFDLATRKQRVRTLRFQKAFQLCQSRLAIIEKVKSPLTPHLSPLADMDILDATLARSSVPAAIASRPDYMTLVQEFSDILCDLKELQIAYDTERHGEIMKALRDLKHQFGNHVVVEAVAAIEDAGVYLEIDCKPNQRNQVEEFIREHLEGTYATSANQ